MAERKNNHYIPRFYLKRFSVNEEGKRIGVYNYLNGKYILTAPVKSQAGEDYLYGDSGEIESDLAKLETGIAKLFHFWTDEKILIPPPQDSKAFSALKRFILYQLYRTPKAGNVTTQLLNDLDCKFVVNLSDLLFITSDSPVVLYNQFMERAGIYAGATGLPVKGLQIFYSIHPRLMICLYDPKVYIYGDTENCTSTESMEDVHRLNCLQYFNSDQQLFFSEPTTRQEYFENMVNTYKYEKALYPKSINQVIQEENDKFLFFMGVENFHINLDLSFCKIIENVSCVKDSIVPFRHLSMER